MSFIPYTIMEDGSGGLTVYGNMVDQIQLDFHAFLLHLDDAGTIQWSSSYKLQAVWGGAIHTSDGGYLLRSGNLILKTDAVGDVEWSKRLQITSVHHLALAEVSDGYVFSAYEVFAVLPSRFKIGKLDKQGDPVSGSYKEFPFEIVPRDIVTNPQGGITTVFADDFNGMTVSSLLTFDKDLNLLDEVFITSGGHEELRAYDLNYLTTGQPVIVGNTVQQDQLFTGVFDDQGQHECDTALSRIAPSSTTFQAQNNSKVALPVTFLDSTSTTLRASFQVNVQSLCKGEWPNTVDLGPDTVVCEGERVQLYNRNEGFYDEYLWSTGEDAPTVVVTVADTYVLGAVNACIQDTLYDTLVLETLPRDIPVLPDDVKVCADSTVEITASVCATCSFEWNTGDTGLTIQPDGTGWYSVRQTNADGCIGSDSIFVEFTICNSTYQIPNVFTPNGDGINDWFEVEANGLVGYDLKIYNRWGEVLFESERSMYGWNGRSLSGTEVPSGTYFYTIEAQVYENEVLVSKTWTGHVTLLR